MRTSWLALPLFLVACGGSSEPAPVEPVPAPGPAAAADTAPAGSEPAAAPAEDPALIAAAEAYTRKNAAAGLEFTLKLQAQEGDFALLVVEPKKEDADAALLFMKREGGAWKGLDLGTGIDCSDLRAEGVPDSLCASLR
ncbi:MAG TPA: hypothetical protein VFU21_30765 [Kofleriaceae bacterium]|nr:hypothetical protein [Kofleriaceae bacterium]